MKVDFYISSLSGGGAEKVLVTLAENFAQRNNEVSIFSLEKRPQFYQVSERVLLEKITQEEAQRKLSDYKAIRHRIKKRNADVVISFLSRCNLLVLLGSSLRRQKVIVCDRNNPLKEHSKYIFGVSCLIYSVAKGIVVQTNQIKSYYPRFLQKKIIVLENPLDTEKLDAQCAGREIVQENTIISMGRLEPQKDYDTLIRAFAHIHSSWRDWKLHIFGIGNQKERLQKLIDELGLTDSVILCGRTENPFLAMKQSKIFVLSSNYEGFPNVLCEGMYAGLPCISSDCISGPRELIKDGENGYLFEVGNVEQLSEKMKLLLESETLRIKFGIEGKETVKRLERLKICDKWYEFVERIAEGTKE